MASHCDFFFFKVEETVSWFKYLSQYEGRGVLLYSVHTLAPGLTELPRLALNSLCSPRGPWRLNPFVLDFWCDCKACAIGLTNMSVLLILGFKCPQLSFCCQGYAFLLPWFDLFLFYFVCVVLEPRTSCILGHILSLSHTPIPAFINFL